MKTCSNCQHSNEDDWQYCANCGKRLPIVATPPVLARPFDAPPAPHLLSSGFFVNAAPIDVSKINMGFSMVERISRPDWKLVTKSITHSFPPEKWPPVWREAGILWLAQLKRDLGGSYDRFESQNILLLSSQETSSNEAMLNAGEAAIRQIQTSLAPLLSRQDGYGKYVILVFDSDADYYAYISYFYPEGHHSTSSGVFVRQGYGHVALPYASNPPASEVITHELIHNALWHLPIPLWLNEAISMHVGDLISGRLRRILLDRELATRHRGFWNTATIQEFWAGTSFHGPGDPSQLSYNLAEILLQLILQKNNWNDVMQFAARTDYRDGGLAAAQTSLKLSVEDFVIEFLGPGNWRPDPVTIAQILAQLEPAST